MPALWGNTDNAANMQALRDTQGCKQLNYEMLFDRQIELKIQDNITLVPELLHMEEELACDLDHAET